MEERLRALGVEGELRLELLGGLVRATAAEVEDAQPQPRAPLLGVAADRLAEVPLGRVP